MKSSMRDAAERAAEIAEKLYNEADRTHAGPTRDKLIDQANAALAAAARAAEAVRAPRVTRKKTASKRAGR